MNLYNLLSSNSRQLEDTSDVCIIGAGAAGLYLARCLIAKGYSVIVLEAGGEVCVDGGAFGSLPIFTGDVYLGATLGRAFGLGGSTSRWGGLLVPHSSHDVRSREAEKFDPWRFIVSQVAERTNAVLVNLGLNQTGDFTSLPQEKLAEIAEDFKAQNLDIVAALFLPFQRRNLSYLLTQHGNQTAGLRLYLNAVCTSWKKAISPNGLSHFNTVEAKSVNGNSVRIRARHMVITAGAIESARILLEIKKAFHPSVISETAAIGCYLSDHLSCRIAEVSPKDYRQIADYFGPRFVKGLLRSFRFIDNAPLPDTPRWFAHFIFDIDNPAFRLAKEWLLSIQSRRRTHVNFKECVAGIAGLFSFAFSRYIKSALFIPDGTPVHLQLDIEQIPMRCNAVSLAEELDQYDRPVAKIDWRVTETDFGSIHRIAEYLIKKWPGLSGSLPKLIPAFINGNGPKPHDAYHPVGTCRMGDDKEAVVDQDLRVRGTENLWVLSTGVLPSAGTANPTFTMLCLGDGLADRLIAALN